MIIIYIYIYYIWLVVWNIFFYVSIYWECHHPNWRTHIFQRGKYTTNQIYIYIYIKQIDRFSPWQGLEPRTMKSFSQDLLQRDDLMGLEDLRGFHVDLPSGYDWHSHGKWPIEIDGLPEFTY